MMKTTNLIKANEAYTEFYRAMRLAHTDAIKSKNEFAELAVFGVMEDAAKLAQKIGRVITAAS